MTFRDKKTLGHFDLESTELLIRTSMQGVGAVFLEKLLNSDKGKKTTEEYAQLKEYRNKTLQTVLGKVVVKRAYYYDKKTKTDQRQL